METKLRTAYKADVTLPKISKLKLGDNIFWVAWLPEVYLGLLTVKPSPFSGPQPRTQLYYPLSIMKFMWPLVIAFRRQRVNLLIIIYLSLSYKFQSVLALLEQK